MPIKPENAHRYPPNWPEIRARILRRAGGKCEACGVDNHALGGRDERSNWHPAWPLEERRLRLAWPLPGTKHWCGVDRALMLRIVRIVLTIAHLDHTPENCADDNLRAWCQRCHLAYDREHHRRAGKAVAELF